MRFWGDPVVQRYVVKRLHRYAKHIKNTYLAEMWSGSQEGSY